MQLAIKNLKILLSGSNDRVPGVMTSGIPRADSDRRNSFIELRAGAAGPAAVHYSTAGDPLYVMYESIPVLNDRIKACDTITLSYADVIDAVIAVEHRPRIEVEARMYAHHPDLGNPNRDSDLRPYIIAFPLNDISFFFETLEDAANFADNLYFIQQQLKQTVDGRFDQFEARAAQYRELKVKPVVSETQRKFIVQANSMTQSKDYAKAVELYLKAVDVDPVAYPAAYFNLAMLSAQLKKYPRAIAYMKKYLLLVPGAEDARSAQDKIYEWEVRGQP
jgi:tetratricopeptide (TPR) repeat protein